MKSEKGSVEVEKLCAQLMGKVGSGRAAENPSRQSLKRFLSEASRKPSGFTRDVDSLSSASNQLVDRLAEKLKLKSTCTQKGEWLRKYADYVFSRADPDSKVESGLVLILGSVAFKPLEGDFMPRRDLVDRKLESLSEQERIERELIEELRLEAKCSYSDGEESDSGSLSPWSSDEEQASRKPRRISFPRKPHRDDSSYCNTVPVGSDIHETPQTSGSVSSLQLNGRIPTRLNRRESVKEAIWHLSGVGTVGFFSVKGDSVTIQRPVEGHSIGNLASIAEICSVAAKKVQTLDEFSKKSYSFETVRALQGWVNRYLSQFISRLSRLQKQCDTFSRFIFSSKGLISELNAVFYLLESFMGSPSESVDYLRVQRLFSDLCKALASYASCEKSLAYLILDLCLEMHRPIFDMIDSVIHHGIIHSRIQDEFPVKRSPGLKGFEAKTCGSTFLKPVLEELALTIQSRWLIGKLKEAHKLRIPTWNESSYSELRRKLKKTNEASDKTESCFLSIHVGKLIEENLRLRFHSLSSFLISVLNDVMELPRIMQEIKDVYTLFAVEELPCHLSLTSSQGLSSDLTEESVSSVFKMALLDFGMGKKSAGRWEVKAESDQTTGSPRSHAIRIFPNIAWPLDFIISEEIISRYQRIFSFLCGLQNARQHLVSLRFQDMRTSSPKLGKNLMLLRFHFLHTLTSIFCVVQDQFHGSFDSSSVTKAPNVHAALEAHDELTRKLLDVCLVSAPFHLVQDTVCKLSRTALQLAQAWRNQCSENELLDIKKTLNKCERFLTTFLASNPVHRKETRGIISLLSQ